jgi:hypothetical protein
MVVPWDCDLVLSEQFALTVLSHNRLRCCETDRNEKRISIIRIITTWNYFRLLYNTSFTPLPTPI